MKIVAVETYWTRIPYDMGGTPAVLSGINGQAMMPMTNKINNTKGKSDSARKYAEEKKSRAPERSRYSVKKRADKPG